MNVQSSRPLQKESRSSFLKVFLKTFAKVLRLAALNFES